MDIGTTIETYIIEPDELPVRENTPEPEYVPEPVETPAKEPALV